MTRESGTRESGKNVALIVTMTTTVFLCGVAWGISQSSIIGNSNAIADTKKDLVVVADKVNCHDVSIAETKVGYKNIEAQMTKIEKKIDRIIEGPCGDKDVSK